mmetsp:Transcript_8119/g.20979  ORF Transcript_8119/g.20979 Transcript_8119/m.20979 type:complete len:320 (-) Transcript_8119:67-1026(-)
MSGAYQVGQHIEILGRLLRVVVPEDGALCGCTVQPRRRRAHIVWRCGSHGSGGSDSGVDASGRRPRSLLLGVQVGAEVRLEADHVAGNPPLRHGLDAREEEAVDADRAARLVKVGDLARQLDPGRRVSLVRESDRPILLLDAVLQEEGHLDPLISKEAAERLLEGRKFCAAHRRVLCVDLPDDLVDEVDHGLRLLHLGAQLVEVVERHEQHLLGVAARKQLVFEAHRHQVEELVHARLVQPHDGRVREPVEDLTGGVHAVHLLRPEELRDEHRIVHGADDILQDSCRLVGRHALRLQPLLEDVDHLAAHVDNEHRHAEL